MVTQMTHHDAVNLTISITMHPGSGSISHWLVVFMRIITISHQRSNCQIDGMERLGLPRCHSNLIFGVNLDRPHNCPLSGRLMSPLADKVLYLPLYLVADTTLRLLVNCYCCTSIQEKINTNMYEKDDLHSCAFNLSSSGHNYYIFVLSLHNYNVSFMSIYYPRPLTFVMEECVVIAMIKV